jgi:MscS family membrane protein
MSRSRPTGTIQLLLCILACFICVNPLFAQRRSAPKAAASPAPGRSGASSLAAGPATTPSVPGDQTVNQQPSDPLGRSTPYGCFVGFLRAVNDDKLATAVQYLDTKLPEERANELAKQLKAVLDLGLSANIDSISKDEQGSLEDNLRVTREKIGTVKTKRESVDILLDRVRRGQEPAIWLFSSDTLARIPEAYADLQTNNPVNRLPAFLSTKSVFGFAVGRWLGIAIALAFALLFSSAITRLLLLIGRLFFRTIGTLNGDEALKALKQPVRLLLLAMVVWYMGGFSVSVLARHYWTIFAEFLTVAGSAFLLARIADLVANTNVRRSISAGLQERIAVITLTQRLLKILFLIIAVLTFLRVTGVNVSAMLAGLGIGGIALALAAQKTLEDLFGGISIIVRKAVRVGDYCRVGDQNGVIEDIGLSSTRLRTLDRTLISIPNANVAQLNSENFTLRDKFLFQPVFLIRGDTLQAQLERVLIEIQAVMDRDSRVERGTSRVRFTGIRDGLFRLEVFAYVKTPIITEFLLYQQELLLGMLTAVSTQGVRLAFPSQANYLELPEPAKAKLAQNRDKPA